MRCSEENPSLGRQKKRKKSRIIFSSKHDRIFKLFSFGRSWVVYNFSFLAWIWNCLKIKDAYFLWVEFDSYFHAREDLQNASPFLANQANSLKWFVPSHVCLSASTNFYQSIQTLREKFMPAHWIETKQMSLAIPRDGWTFPQSWNNRIMIRKSFPLRKKY